MLFYIMLLLEKKSFQSSMIMLPFLICKFSWNVPNTSLTSRFSSFCFNANWTFLVDPLRARSLPECISVTSFYKANMLNWYDLNSLRNWKIQSHTQIISSLIAVPIILLHSVIRMYSTFKYRSKPWIYMKIQYIFKFKIEQFYANFAWRYLSY